jgi:hypothetical protein
MLGGQRVHCPERSVLEKSQPRRKTAISKSHTWIDLTVPREVRIRPRWTWVGRTTIQRAPQKRDRPSPPLDTHPKTAVRMDPPTGWRGGRTSVSAPLGAHPQKPNPTGRQTTWIGQAPRWTPIQRQPCEWTHQPGGGGADLCVRSAGCSSSETQSDGPPNDMDRPSPPLDTHPKTTVRMDPPTGWRGGGPLCPLRWVWIVKNCANGQPNNMHRPKTAKDNKFHSAFLPRSTSLQAMS